MVLYADNLTEKANVLNDESIIVKELIQILKDKHSNPGNVSADQQQLLADRVQLQTDEIAGLNLRIATREKYFTTLSNDLTNLVTAAESDPMPPRPCRERSPNSRWIAATLSPP